MAMNHDRLIPEIYEKLSSIEEQLTTLKAAATPALSSGQTAEPEANGRSGSKPTPRRRVGRARRSEAGKDSNSGGDSREAQGARELAGLVPPRLQVRIKANYWVWASVDGGRWTRLSPAVGLMLVALSWRTGSNEPRPPFAGPKRLLAVLRRLRPQRYEKRTLTADCVRATVERIRKSLPAVPIENLPGVGYRAAVRGVEILERPSG